MRSQSFEWTWECGPSAFTKAWLCRPLWHKCGVSDNGLGHALWIQCISIWRKCRFNLALGWLLGISFLCQRSRILPMLWHCSETNCMLLFRKLMEALSIWTRPATCFVSAVRLCLKQFHKDHYFLSQDALQLNKILLRLFLPFVQLTAAALMVQLKMN